MKNLIKFIGIITLLTIAGISIVSCDDSTDKADITDTPVTTYEITFCINDGLGTIPEAQTVEADSSIILPDESEFSKSGFYFGGWNTCANGTETNYYAGESFTPTSDITLYARWLLVPTYRLTINRNPTLGGTTSQGSFSGITAGTPINITATENTDFRFVNWTVMSGTATIANAYNAITTVTLQSDATIRANFQEASRITIEPTSNGNYSLLSYGVRFPATIEILIAGGGGGGQGGHYNVGADRPDGTGGGGGAGAVARAKFVVHSNKTFNVTLGAPGSGGQAERTVLLGTGIAGWQGGNGRETRVSWDGITIVAAGGGGGGRDRSWESRGSLGGLGGIASSSPSGSGSSLIEWFSYDGQNGGNGLYGVDLRGRGWGNPNHPLGGRTAIGASNVFGVIVITSGGNGGYGCERPAISSNHGTDGSEGSVIILATFF